MEGVGKVAMTVAPVAAFVPGVGPAIAGGLMAGGAAVHEIGGMFGKKKQRQRKPLHVDMKSMHSQQSARSHILGGSPATWAPGKQTERAMKAYRSLKASGEHFSIEKFRSGDYDSIINGGMSSFLHGAHQVSKIARDTGGERTSQYGKRAARTISRLREAHGIIMGAPSHHGVDGPASESLSSQVEGPRMESHRRSVMTHGTRNRESGHPAVGPSHVRGMMYDRKRKSKNDRKRKSKNEHPGKKKMPGENPSSMRRYTDLYGPSYFNHFLVSAELPWLF